MEHSCIRLTTVLTITLLSFFILLTQILPLMILMQHYRKTKSKTETIGCMDEIDRFLILRP